MKITAIKQQIKNVNRVSLFIDAKYSFSLTLDQLLEQKLKKGDELEESDIKRLKKLSDDGKMRQRIIEWLMNRPHSTRELRDYMYRKKVEKEQGEQWIEEFTEKKLVSDEYFAKWFAENRLRKNKSKRAIKSELLSKGINLKLADNVLSDVESGDKEALQALIVKLSQRLRYKDQQKLISHLLGKGFSYGDIKDAMKGDE